MLGDDLAWYLQEYCSIDVGMPMRYTITSTHKGTCTMAPIVISAPTIEGATLVASNFIGTHKITIKFTAGYWWATLRRTK